MKRQTLIVFALLGVALVTGCGEKTEPTPATPAAQVSQPATNTPAVTGAAPVVGGGTMVTTNTPPPASGLPPVAGSAPGAPPAMSAPVVTQNAPQQGTPQGASPAIPGSYNSMPPAPQTGARSMAEQRKDKAGL